MDQLFSRSVTILSRHQSILQPTIEQCLEERFHSRSL
uniref:Uncharacterized protein n=1 Tax=Cupressus sempervirens TaxID=13469 RepID=B6V6P9_CUPSE|nr:unknown [Cupressus sempervirens]